DVDRTRPVELIDDDRRVPPFGVPQRGTYQRGVRRIEQTVHLHDVDPGRGRWCLRARGRRPRERGSDEAAERGKETPAGEATHLVSRTMRPPAAPYHAPSMRRMDVRRFCTTSNVVIVAGKGGVGKTTVTAALAVTAARAGLRVMIVEVEGKSGLAAMFGAPSLGYDELPLRDGVQARFLTPDAALVDYLVSHGMRRISKRLRASGALEVVATAVPGMK